MNGRAVGPLNNWGNHFPGLPPGWEDGWEDGWALGPKKQRIPSESHAVQLTIYAVSRFDPKIHSTMRKFDPNSIHCLLVRRTGTLIVCVAVIRPTGILLQAVQAIDHQSKKNSGFEIQ